MKSYQADQTDSADCVRLAYYTNTHDRICTRRAVVVTDVCSGKQSPATDLAPKHAEEKLYLLPFNRQARKCFPPAVNGDECQSWADHPVMVAKTLDHHGTALVHPSRPAAPALVKRVGPGALE